MDFNTGISQLSIPQIISASSYVIQAFVFFVMFLYLFFAFVLIRRLKIMNLNFRTPYSMFFAFIARLHFFATLLILILTFLTLRR
jgi:hypothetical protein